VSNITNIMKDLKGLFVRYERIYLFDLKKSFNILPHSSDRRLLSISGA